MSTTPAECDRTTVYAGECRNFADTEWIRFDSGRRRSPDARDGNTWLIDVAHGSFWMADDQVRNLVPLVPATAGGQWTRDDLPSEGALADLIRDALDGGIYEGKMLLPGHRLRAIIDLLARWMNAHHPKPSRGVETGYALQVDALTRERDALDSQLTRVDMECAEAVTARVAAERTCDELRSLIEGQKEHVSKLIEVRNRMRRERDTAFRDADHYRQLRNEQFARAEAAERVLRERDEQEDDATRAACERAEQAENARDTATTRAEQLEKEVCKWRTSTESAHSDFLQAAHDRDEWKARATLAEQERENWRITAINRATPAVTRADIEKALDVGIRGTTDGGLVGQDTSIPSGECVRLAVDAVCDLLGIEAEQAVDPVEEKAAELYGVANPGVSWARLVGSAEDDNGVDREVVREYRAIARYVLGQEADQ